MARKTWKDSGCYERATQEPGSGPIPHVWNWVPQLTEEELTDLPLTSHDVFVLSFVNGRRSLGAIAAIAGLSSADLRDTTQRLVQLGAIVPRWENEDAATFQGLETSESTP